MNGFFLTTGRRGWSAQIPFILAWDENLGIGSDNGTSVDDKDYQVPFAFTGKIDKITLTIDRPKLTQVDKKRLMQAVRENKVSA